MAVSMRWELLLKRRRMVLDFPKSCDFTRKLSSSRFKYAQMPRITVAVEDSVAHVFEDPNFKAKRHPGVIFRGRVCLPQEFTDSARAILACNLIKQKTEEMHQYVRHLQNREPPIEPGDYRRLCNEVETGVRDEDQVWEPFLNSEQKRSLDKQRFFRIKRTIKGLVYHWEPISYTKRNVLHHLAARSDHDYAVTYKILSEIAKRDPTFSPSTMLDFGSGLCTSLWAANAFWNDSLREHFCVDTSPDMNDTAELLLRRNQHDKPTIFHNVFFRQFLPVSASRKYDLIICAFSLFELPSTKARLDVINTLWRKCNKYMVIVEPGSFHGFKLVNEAKEFLLHLDQRTTNAASGHVFSPCAHDKQCPRFHNELTCKYGITFRSLIPFQKEEFRDENFCYIVLKKGNRDPNHNWPRLFEEPLLRRKHVICRLCMPNGTTREAAITKKSSSSIIYQTAKRSKWGDFLPVKQTATLGPVVSDENEGERVNGSDED